MPARSLRPFAPKSGRRLTRPQPRSAHRRHASCKSSTSTSTEKRRMGPRPEQTAANTKAKGMAEGAVESEVAEPRHARQNGGLAPTQMESVAVAIVGGGQAGLATSRELTKAGLEHVVLERGQVGETWRTRWDSFCLVTPNWTVQLPEGQYAGSEPDGFMPRDEFVAYLERYAAESGAPIREHVAVMSLQSLPGDGFVLCTSAGDIHADTVV